jgi:quercetin 2,3-dioxygenase
MLEKTSIRTTEATMIKKISREQVAQDDWGWIQMRSPVLHSAPYGTLAVFTDGIMHPGEGFDMHPHRNLEIVSVILDGEVTHQDSTGNVVKMPAGSVQRISAGAGIYHAEHTTSPQSVRMYQIWFAPHTPNLAPEYVRMSYREQLQKNQLYALVSSGRTPSALTMHADGSIFLGDFAATATTDYTLPTNRKLFVFVADGALKVGDEVLTEQDHARIEGEKSVRFEAQSDTQFIIIEVPQADRRLY